mgnify:CR=1 FL=1
MTANDDIRQQRHLIEQLRRSQVFREYEKAFRECTGLPLSLRSGECFGLAHQGDPRENPFCALLAGRNATCAACLAFQQQLTTRADHEPSTRECHAGLNESAVPVRVGDRIVAYLQTGQLLLQRPTPADLRRQSQRLSTLGVDPGDGRYLEAYTRSRIVPRQQYDAILRLLVIFAQQLGGLSSQLVVQEEHVEQPAIARARAYIVERHAEELTLAEVAGAVKMSSCHFCKSFRKATGLTFTHYLARVRVERVRQSLLDPRVRISEAAYAAGFQSLSQFSRVFRRIAGEAPSAYRERLDHAKSA